MTGALPSSGRTLLPVLSVAVVLFLAAVSPGQPREGSVSLGQANDGQLRHGRRMPEHGTGFLSIPPSPEHDARYGTDELVAALVTIGADVERRAPGATLHIGDLSLEEGGRSPRHESHQAGRDVDLLFYALDPDGRVMRPRGVSYDGEGREVHRPGSGSRSRSPRVFDARRNWLVIRSLIENEEAHLQRAIVAEPLRSLLLEHARDHDEPAWIIERADEVMCPSWSPHADHFHVRLFCTAEDYRQGCRDERPLYPWRRTELAALGILSPEVLEDPNRSRPRARRWLATAAPQRPWCQ